MKTPIFVRPLSEEERESLQKGLRSKDTFTMRRSHMLLASSRGERAPKIALNLGCASQTVRDAIHDFNGRSLWTLAMASEAAFEEGLTEERVSGRRCGRRFRACSWFAGCGRSGG